MALHQVRRTRRGSLAGNPAKITIETKGRPMSSDQITAAALALPPEAKARLAEQLLASLDAQDQGVIDAAWADEAERRIDALDRGDERTVPADEALRTAKARLNDPRRIPGCRPHRTGRQRLITTTRNNLV